MEQKITAKTATFFLCTVAYEKTQEDGTQKRVKEQYIVDALSFTEAENRITDNMVPYISGDFDIADITKAPFSEIFFTGNTEADRYYKVKANFITLDEKTGKEKKSLVYYIVQGVSTKDAQSNFDEVMKGTMIDYSVEAIIETKVLDVFLHEQE